MSKKNRSSKKHTERNDEILDCIQDNALKGFKLNIKKFNFTPKQHEFIKLALDKNTKVMFVRGESGTSKTMMAVYCSLRLLIENPALEIKYIRTIAESADMSIGALPGNVSEKLDPFLIPLFDKLDELLPIQQSKSLIENNTVEAIPINFLRGASFRDQIIISDESQDFSSKELVTLLTRIGEGSKYFVLGDPMQSDIGNKSGFLKMFNLFDNQESKDRGIFTFTFTELDIMRSEILKYIVKQLKTLDKPTMFPNN